MLSKVINKYENKLTKKGPLILWVVGFILFLLVPFLDQKRNVHDESNLRNAFGTSKVSELSKVVRSMDPPKHIVIGGRRSSGAESFLILNCGKSSTAATTLASALKNEPYFSMEVHFYFLSKCSDVDLVELPQGQIRGGLLVDFDSETPSNVCVHTFGQGGLQPNQDLMNTVITAFDARGFGTSLICGCERSTWIYFLTEFVARLMPSQLGEQWVHFSYYLLSMIKDFNATAGGGNIRSAKGVFMVGVSSKFDSRHSHILDAPVSLEYVVRSFNNLNERLHHSVPVWISLSQYLFVDFQLVQVVPFIFIFVGVLIIFEVFLRLKINTTLSKIIFVLPLVFFFSSFGSLEAALISSVLIWTLAFAFSGGALSVELACETWTLGWMVLYLALHPALSVIGNGVLSLQLICFSVSKSRRLIGAFFSFALFMFTLKEVLPRNAEIVDDMTIRSFIFASFQLVCVSFLRVLDR